MQNITNYKSDKMNNKLLVIFLLTIVSNKVFSDKSTEYVTGSIYKSIDTQGHIQYFSTKTDEELNKESVEHDHKNQLLINENVRQQYAKRVKETAQFLDDVARQRRSK